MIGMILFMNLLILPLAQLHIQTSDHVQWISYEYEEHHCVDFKTLPKVSINQTFLNSVREWYITEASKHFVASITFQILNRAMKQNEVNDLCLRWLFFDPRKRNGPYFNIVSAFGKLAILKCTREAYLQQSCVHLGSNSGIEDNVEHPENEHAIVGTDNASWILMLRCIEDTHKDWALLTNNKNLALKRLKSHPITIALGQYGFNPVYNWHVNTSACDT